MNMRDYYFIDSWCNKNINQTDNIGHIGREFRMRSSDHENQRHKEKNVHNELHRIKVGKEYLLNPK